MIWHKLPYYLDAVLRLLWRGRGTPWAIIRILFGRESTISLSDGFKITLSQPLDLLILKETICDDPYEFRSLVDPTHIIDVGGGAGDTGLFVRSVWPSCHVSVCEPNPLSLRLLKKNISQNAAKEQITLYPYAIGTKKLADFYISSSNVMSSTKAYEVSRTKVRVKGLPLSQVISGPVDYLKIDCEGSELDVLQSISASQWKYLSRIGLEYHRHIIPEQDILLQDYLEKKGFSVRKIPDPYNSAIGYLLAVRKGLL
jgi:FkbM family methyltransferase